MLSGAKHLAASFAKSLLEFLDFSPFDFTAKADASGIDLKVHVA